MAEEVGFEPTESLATLNGFQDRLLKPLGHSSIVKEPIALYVDQNGRVVNLFAAFLAYLLLLTRISPIQKEVGACGSCVRGQWGVSCSS